MGISEIKKKEKIADAIRDPYDHTRLIEFIDEDTTTYVIDGHTVVKNNGTGEFLGYVFMSDQYFYDNWLTQFAIGNVGGRNYFNTQAWSDITDQLTKGVIVVHEETKELLFLIPKFIEPVYSRDAKGLVSRLCKLASNAQFQTDIRQQNETINALAKHLSDISAHDVPNEGVTGLVPSAIYTFYDVNPKAMKATIYIRDHYKTLNMEDDSFDRLSDILKRHFDGKPVSYKDKEFVQSVSNNEFFFGDEVEKDTNKKEEADIYKGGFSPFQD